MKKPVIIGIVVILVVVVAGGSLAWLYCNNQTSNQTPSSLSVEQIRDRAIVYIAANHTDSVQLMQALSWTGGRQDTGLLGSETYLYSSGNWTLEITYPVVPEPTYTISANYTSTTDTVTWTGTFDGVITETSQSFTIPNVTLSAPEQVRDTIMLYLGTYHNETVTYMQNIANTPWTGGRETPEGLVGSETYAYLNGGSASWTVSIQYPVVFNPIYNVNATYSSAAGQAISWQGTMQSGAITQIDYKFEQ